MRLFKTYLRSLQSLLRHLKKKKLCILFTNAETLLIITAKFGLQNRERDKNFFEIPNSDITGEILMESLSNASYNFSFQFITRVQLF